MKSSMVVEEAGRASVGRADLWVYAALALCLGWMYVPAYMLMIRELAWGSRDTAHGPLVLVVSAWLIWSQREVLIPIRPQLAQPMTWMLLALALLIYCVGYSQDFSFLTIASQLPLLLALARLLLGPQRSKRLTFPILFLFFSVPLPGSAIDPLLVPLKIKVSTWVSNMLYAFDLPITNSGAIILAGPYRLLVADACSGMNTFIALLGIGLLYVHLMFKRFTLATWLLLLLSPLIVLLTNFARILTLVLVTYYVGDEAGRAFHNSAGILEVLFSYLIFYGLGHVLIREKPGHSEASQDPVRPLLSTGGVERADALAEPASFDQRAWVLPVLLVLAVLVANGMRPTRLYQTRPVDLEAVVPRAFAGWHMLNMPLAQQGLTAGVGTEASNQQPYDQTLMRSYVDASGNVVMLALAYGRQQGQVVRVHRPELCYAAQGANVFGSHPLSSVERRGMVPEHTVAMFGQSMVRTEQVMYWIRIGNAIPNGAFEERYQVFIQRLKGIVPDGILVRTSQVIPNVREGAGSIKLQEDFVHDMLNAIPAEQRSLLLATST